MIGELNAGEIQRLRMAVSNANHRQRFTGAIRWIEYSGGPLDGLYSPMAAADALHTIIAWCLVISTGPVQVFYVQRDQPLVRYFQRIELMAR